MSKPSKAEQIITAILQPDIWCAIMRVVSSARWKDLCAIGRKEGNIYVIHADKVSPEAIVALQNFETLLILIEGKVSKSILSASEREYFSQQARESNSWLN